MALHGRVSCLSDPEVIDGALCLKRGCYFFGAKCFRLKKTGMHIHYTYTSVCRGFGSARTRALACTCSRYSMVSCETRTSLTDKSSLAVGGRSSAVTSENAT